MKTKIIRRMFLFSSLLAAFSILPAQSTNKDTCVINTSAQCEMCKERIERNLFYEPGIIKAHLNLETKQVTVVYKAKKIDVYKIKQVISKTGYDADDIKADKKVYDKLPKCCQKGGEDMHKQ